MSFRWSRKEEDLFVEIVKTSESYAEVSRKMRRCGYERSKQACQQKACHLNIPISKASPFGRSGPQRHKLWDDEQTDVLETVIAQALESGDGEIYRKDWPKIAALVSQKGPPRTGDACSARAYSTGILQPRKKMESTPKPAEVEKPKYVTKAEQFRPRDRAAKTVAAPVADPVNNLLHSMVRKQLEEMVPAEVRRQLLRMLGDNGAS